MTMLVEYGRQAGELEVGLSIDVGNLPPRAEVLEALSKPVCRRARQISDPDTVAKALGNEPFEDYPRVIYGYRRLFGEESGERGRFNASCKEVIEGFLRRTFHSLRFVPEISFDPKCVSEREEQKEIDKAAALYRSAHMDGQVGPLIEAYDGLRALRRVFGGGGEDASAGLETVVPARYLPELLVAAPVWYVQSKEAAMRETRGALDSTVRYFCDLGETDQFAYLFQIYNSRVRSFGEFSGPDLIPMPLVKLISQVGKLFDYLVIATPYHAVALREWEEEFRAPPPKPDPFLFGFLKHVPEYMFFLGRWSGRDLFPSIGEMIADTIEHLRERKEKLVNLGGSFSWYKTDTNTYDVQKAVYGPRLRPVENYQTPKELCPRGKREQERWKVKNNSLVMFVDRISEQFENASLFSWLRGDSA